MRFTKLFDDDWLQLERLDCVTTGGGYRRRRRGRRRRQCLAVLLLQCRLGD